MTHEDDATAALPPAERFGKEGPAAKTARAEASSRALFANAAHGQTEPARGPPGGGPLLTTAQAARKLNMSEDFLNHDRMRDEPRIPFARIGRAIRYRDGDLDAFVEANLQTAAA